MIKNIKSKIKFYIYCITLLIGLFVLMPEASYKMIKSTNMLSVAIILLLIFTAVFASAFIGSDSISKFISLYGILINIVLIIFTAEYLIKMIYAVNNNYYYEMIWICGIFASSAGVYTAAALSHTDNFKYNSQRFWLYFTPTYVLTFMMIFLRKPNSYFELNLKIGKGILSYTEYIAGNLDKDFWLLFNILGNVLFFIPMVFIVSALFSRLKAYQALLISCIIPFIAEGYQFIFKCGSVDIDDIILNIAGIIIGYIICIIVRRINKIPQ